MELLKRKKKIDEAPHSNKVCALQVSYYSEGVIMP